MCRGKKYCTELGDNPSEWDTDCPLRLPGGYGSAVDTFTDAVQLFVEGQRSQCISLLETIDSASRETITINMALPTYQMESTVFLMILSPHPTVNLRGSLLRALNRVC